MDTVAEGGALQRIISTACKTPRSAIVTDSYCNGGRFLHRAKATPLLSKKRVSCMIPTQFFE